MKLNQKKKKQIVADIFYTCEDLNKSSNISFKLKNKFNYLKRKCCYSIIKRFDAKQQHYPCHNPNRIKC